MPVRTVTKYKPYQKKSLQKRVAYLERKVWENRPEAKFLSFFHNTITLAGEISVTQLCNINYGDGNNNRIGNDILIHKIEIRGHLGDAYAECLLLVGHGVQQSPIKLDFDMNKGGGVRPSHRRAYRTLQHIWKNNSTNRFTRIVNFKKPLRVSYDGGSGTDASNNVVYLVFKNCLSSTTVTPEISVLVHYTDP